MDRTYEFELIDKRQLNLQEYNSFKEQSVFVTLPWIEFIEEDSHAQAVFVRIQEQNMLVGYFTGLITRKAFIKILGSPFGGWSTCFMGISSENVSDKISIVKQLVPFLYKSTGCAYIEIIDRDIMLEEARDEGITCFEEGTLELPINLDDVALFKQMKTDCRNFIRQFERRGARLEIAEPDELFAEQYYQQLEDVFAKQGLVPTYSVEKVKRLLRHLGNTGEVLCLRVFDPEENCIATSIFLGFHNKCFFWGGASFREGQHYRPNEYMIWTAIKYWRERGCTVFDMVGIRDYKRKFGSTEAHYARMVFTKHKILIIGRKYAAKLYYSMTKVMGLLKHRK